jgi:hypothetical protein
MTRADVNFYVTYIDGIKQMFSTRNMIPVLCNRFFSSGEIPDVDRKVLGDFHRSRTTSFKGHKAYYKAIVQQVWSIPGL